jgi:hypothetical protein
LNDQAKTRRGFGQREEASPGAEARTKSDRPAPIKLAPSPEKAASLMAGAPFLPYTL